MPEANKEGGYGDVTEVWAAFAERFAWVARVAGNHDDVSQVPGLADNVHLLDGNRVTLDEIRIGGVGGIVGTKPKSRVVVPSVCSLRTSVVPSVPVVDLNVLPLKYG